MRARIAVIACAVLVAAVAAWALLGQGSKAEVVLRSSGDQTTEKAVVGALRSTGYRLRFRATPHVEGYDMVAGEARGRHGGDVAFSVVIRLSGKYGSDPEGTRRASPQFPVVPYAVAGSTVTGNEVLRTQPQSPYKAGHLKYVGPALVATNGEAKMATRISSAVSRLFAPEVRGQA